MKCICKPWKFENRPYGCYVKSCHRAAHQRFYAEVCPIPGGRFWKMDVFGGGRPAVDMVFYSANEAKDAADTLLNARCAETAPPLSGCRCR